jgi:phosphoribosyl 1,2-cyclic phosphodiesterase
VNVLIEAMTEGGFRKRGVLICPRDAIEGEAVVFSNFTGKLERIEIMGEGKNYKVKDVTFSTPVKHIHPVETYGLLFDLGIIVSMISDTRYFDELSTYYASDVMIVNVLRSKPIGKDDEIDHLSLPDFVNLVKSVKPKVAIMTHFGMSLIREKPHIVAERVKEETGVEVVAAYDGMEFPF